MPYKSSHESWSLWLDFVPSSHKRQCKGEHNGDNKVKSQMSSFLLRWTHQHMFYLHVLCNFWHFHANMSNPAIFYQTVSVLASWVEWSLLQILFPIGYNLTNWLMSKSHSHLPFITKTKRKQHLQVLSEIFASKSLVWVNFGLNRTPRASHLSLQNPLTWGLTSEARLFI